MRISANASTAELDDRQCGWIETLPAALPPRRLEGTRRTRYAVLGAGLTGLAAARRLAELAPDQQILLLDAQRAGDGASGRSSGFVVDLASFVADMPAAPRERYIRLARHGIEELRRQVEAAAIDCSWDENGWLHVAASGGGEAALETLANWLQGRDDNFEWLGAEGMAKLCGSSFYRAGLRLPGSISLQSAALTRGLAAALPENVELLEYSPIHRLRRLGGNHGAWQLRSPRGEVRADKVLVALNAYAPTLGLLRRRVLPLYSFGSLTRPLTESEQAALGATPTWGLLAQDPMGSSVRRTQDQRLLIRNTAYYSRSLRLRAKVRKHAMAAHRRALAGRYPGLAEVDFEYSWAGLLGTSRNTFPFFGQIDEGLVASAGFTGCGIAMGTTLGGLLAELVTGADSELLSAALRQPGPRWLPPQPLLDPAVRWKVAQMNAQAGEWL